MKYFTRRIVRVKEKEDLVKILTESMPNVTDLSQETQDELSEQCKGMLGSFILTTKPEQANAEDDLSISFIAWLGKSTIRPLINAQTRSFFMTILGIENSVIGNFFN